MGKHGERAMSLFKEGYNCAQAVFMSFSDETGIDEKTAARLASSFGGGIGRMREVCGAVSGMCMALGAIKGYDDPEDSAAKSEQYKLVQRLAGRFKEENGSIICRELLGLTEKSSSPVPAARTEEYYKKRPCVELVGQCADILEEYLKGEK